MTSPTKPTKTELRTQLEALRLPRTAADLDDFLARATKGRWSVPVVLEELARQELQERERRSLERRLRAAHLGRFKPIDEFDWNWPTKIDRTLIDRALGGDLVRERENLVLVAAQGLGKTMLALQHGRLPPSINCETPNPELRLEETPFFINTEARAWTPASK